MCMRFSGGRVGAGDSHLTGDCHLPPGRLFTTPHCGACLSPLGEQRRIVAYLDGLQARDDALQAKNGEELAALLPSILDKAFTLQVTVTSAFKGWAKASTRCRKVTVTYRPPYFPNAPAKNATNRFSYSAG